MDRNDRLRLVNAYRGHLFDVFGLALPAASSAAEMLELIKSIPAPPFEAGAGVTSDPPFPGACELPEEMPTGWRMICACRVFDSEQREATVLFITFVSGRKPTIFDNEPGTLIPERYLPLASR
jgi:hypothetical protein